MYVNCLCHNKLHGLYDGPFYHRYFYTLPIHTALIYIPVAIMHLYFVVFTLSLVKESFYLKQSTHSSMTRLLYNDYHDTSVVSVVELMPHSGTINQYTQPKPLLFPTLLIEATEVHIISTV